MCRAMLVIGVGGVRRFAWQDTRASAITSVAIFQPASGIRDSLPVITILLSKQQTLHATHLKGTDFHPFSRIVAGGIDSERRGTGERMLTYPNPPSPEPGTALFGTERLIIRRYLPQTHPPWAAADYPEVPNGMAHGFPSPYTVADAEEFISRHDQALDLAYPTHAGIFVKPNSPGNVTSEPLLIGGIGADALGDVYYRTWHLGYFLTPRGMQRRLSVHLYTGSLRRGRS
ncbi:Uncharacterized protein TPAR_08957 [Tolypocladium paradoxum]|uniref:Uncharacterized protein n=1 Tax=Tolypocladium paradoxum TaxID=94208 RepID=A0A2S4KL09_9HYPO|nr:Uncharacterized protein TPAR_08957 [Tolypocladium paradoxum]